MKKFIFRALVYLRSILLVDLALAALVALSFLFTGSFSFTSFSERIFYAGLGMTLIAFFVAMAAGFAGQGFGIPLLIRKPEEAKNLLTHFGEYRELVEKRYDVGIQLFLIGLGCIAISALVQIFLT